MYPIWIHQIDWSVEKIDWSVEVDFLIMQKLYIVGHEKIWSAEFSTKMMIGIWEKTFIWKNQV